MAQTPIAEIVHDSVSVQDNGIRIPACPECGNPVMVAYGLSTGKFGACPWEDCGAWLAYEVEIGVETHETRQAAKEAYADAC
jgi:endogenous inhibitor of DNA gyrase (YacG/DUF329 family)